ncbi:MAG TPA: hypothetical protein VFQ45_03675 [Longimicrobium sp.]|nr:hypothetical protein [Longimicrobium sp.]
MTGSPEIVPPLDPRPRPSAAVLEPERIIETLDALRRRIEERFPGSGLGWIAGQMLEIARTTAARLEWAARPHLWLRAGAGLLIALLLLLLASLVLRLDVRSAEFGAAELLQATEAATNEAIILGGGIWFLVTAEARFKRRKALRALRDLRAVAHIIDMHQLTKDPDSHLRGAAAATPSSPTRSLDRDQLGRYLDYCSEMLALNSKLAALYAQNFDDHVVLAAVDEVETLTTGLTAKIWQKLNILGQAPTN